MKTVAILGSTGAIGTRALQVIDELSQELTVDVLVAGHNMSLFADQVKRFQPKFVSVADEEAKVNLLERLGNGPRPDIAVGDEGLLLGALYPSDLVINAVMGARGILPALKTVERGARLCLANKECLVAAGDFIMALSKRVGNEIIPVDSEHCALFQCMLAGKPEEIERWTVTASGGPFRTLPKEKLGNVTVADALAHPNWSMGKKITVDSATLMNKGLEVIEAHHLFGAPYDKIEVLVHPESIIHSMVEYVDGSVMAQLATHDMRLPIQYAVTYPRRVQAPWPRLNLAALGRLTFEEPKIEQFPALNLAIEAGRAGGFAPCILNAANEVAVEAFLTGRISFVQVTEVVHRTLEAIPAESPTCVEDVLTMDLEARERARAILQKGG